MKKIISIDQVAKIVARLRKAGKKIVTTNGCFDLLHVGHVRALAFAHAQGDVLFVGINSDSSVRKNKGAGRPIVPARERAEVLAALESVDYVCIFGEKTPIQWIKKIKPHVHVKSSDYAMSQIVEKDAVEKSGGKVVIFAHTGVHSTSLTLKKIRSSKSR